MPFNLYYSYSIRQSRKVPKTRIPSLNFRKWIHLFKSFHVHFSIERQVLAELLLPIMTIPCIAVSILCNFVAIKLNVGTSIRFSLVLGSISVMTPFCLLLYLLGKLTRLQEISIRRKRLELASTISRRSLNCLKCQAYSIGSFCYIDQLLPFNIIYLVINFTITLLITFPEFGRFTFI